MRKKLLSLLTLALCLCSGAWAAKVDDLVEITGDLTINFSEVMNAAKFEAGKLYANNHIFSPEGNNYASNKGTNSTLNTLNCCRVKSDKQDRLAFKVSGACTLTIYAETRTDRKPFLNTDGSSTKTIEGTFDGNGVATYSIGAAGTYYIVGSGDFFLAGLSFTYPGASYDMNANVDDESHGTATVYPGSVKEGNSVTFTATANVGWKFKNWTNADNEVVSTDNPYTIASVSASVSITANFEAVTTHALTVNAGETGALGQYYDNTVVIQNEGTKVTLPIKNSYFYKEGYTATGWTDGTTDYLFGQEITLDQDYTIYPKFVANTNTLDYLDCEVTWNLAKSVADKLHIENTTGYVVTTALINGETVDVPSFWDNTSGKLDNRSREDALAQVNGGSKFTIPAQKGMTVTLAASYQISATLAGETMTASTASPFTATYTYTGNEDEVEIVISDGRYFSTIIVDYPGPVAAPYNVAISGAPTVAVTKGTEITLTASADGQPSSTFEWFTCDNAEKENPVSVGTGASLSFTTATFGTTYYYVIATNSEGSAASDVTSVTVEARTGKEISQVVFSNTFDAFIEGNTITAYYMAGTTEPTITKATISDGATYSIEGDKLTVTAEDGLTKEEYTIVLSPVTPFAGLSKTFDGTETWVKTGYLFNSERGWRFAKNSDDGRIAKGWTRLYFFVGKAKSVTLTNGGVTSARNIKVYVNGVENTSVTNVPKNSASPNSITIALNEDKYNMVAVVSNQTGGDGGFTAFSLSDPDVSSMSETITPSYAKSTYVVGTNALDFSSVEGLKAYAATNASDGKVTLEEVGTVPAGTPLMLIGTAGMDYSVPVAASATAPAKNMFLAGDGTTVFDGTTYDYILFSDGLFYQIGSGTVATNKAYLHCDSDPTVIGAGSRGLSIVFGDETTGISSISTPHDGYDNFCDLQGRRIGKPTKGLYIVNGKKVIIK